MDSKLARMEYTLYKAYLDKLGKVQKTLHSNDSMPNPINDWWIGMCRSKRLLVMKDKLKEGSVYRGNCRNAQFAKWQGDHFIHIRSKFGSEFLEKINHFEDCDGYDVFSPYFEIQESDLKLPYIENSVNELNNMVASAS